MLGSTSEIRDLLPDVAGLGLASDELLELFAPNGVLQTAHRTWSENSGTYVLYQRSVAERSAR